MKTPVKISEAQVQKTILEWLQVHGIFNFRTNNIGVPLGNGKFRPSPVRGLPDIIVVWHGEFIGLEVKSRTGKQSDFQKEFQKNVTEAGGLYYVVRSIEDCQKIFNRE